MEEKKCIPKIRFPGFTEPWEQRKLGELGECKSGIGFPDSEQGGSVGIPFYKVSDMNRSGNEWEMTSANNYVSDEQIKLKKWKPIEKVPAMLFAKVGAAVLLNRKRICLTHFLMDNNMMAYSFKKEWDPIFGKVAFETIDLPSLIQVGALPSYNASDVESMNVFIPPTIEEQHQIGILFEKINDLITLHQRKLDDLKELKQGLLQKMFQQPGCRVPEIRFPEFSEAWEQRKLDELSNFSKGKGYTKSDLTSEGVPIILYGSMYTDFKNAIHGSNNKVTPKPGSIYSSGSEVIIPASGETAEEIARASAVLNKGIILGGDLNIIKVNGKLLPQFLSLELSNGTLQKELSKKAQGKSVVHLHSEDFQKLAIPFPDLEEQKKISDLSEGFEHLITLHQRKLDDLKKLKKGLLQQMFV